MTDVGEKRTTYRELLSPLAQVVAACDFIGQMQSIVGDEWRESDSPEDKAKHEHESSFNFLDMLEEEEGDGFLEVFSALQASGLRFEVDDQLGEGPATGYFHLKQCFDPIDQVLHAAARRFDKQVRAFAPEPWDLKDTKMCLGWSNLILVPDEEGVVARAQRIVSAPDENVVTTEERRA